MKTSAPAEATSGRNDPHRPRDTSVSVSAIRYDGTDGEGSDYYKVTWSLVVPTAWVDHRDGWSQAVSFETAPAITSLVQVLSGPLYEDGDGPYVVPLPGMDGKALPNWVRGVLKQAVTKRLEDERDFAETDERIAALVSRGLWEVAS
jgi:hypothetical protein